MSDQAKNFEIFKWWKEHILEDKKITRTEILQLWKNVEERLAKNQETYDQLRAQHEAELQLFDEKLKIAWKDKEAEKILINARKENLTEEEKKTSVKSEIKKINALTWQGDGDIQTSLITALGTIWGIESEHFSKIAKKLNVTTNNLSGLIDVCKECDTKNFNIDVIKAIGKIQFFAKEQYLRDVSEALKSGKQYGIDRSAGPATFMTIRKILEANKAIADEKPSKEAGKPEKEVKKDETIKTETKTDWTKTETKTEWNKEQENKQESEGKEIDMSNLDWTTKYPWMAWVSLLPDNTDYLKNTNNQATASVNGTGVDTSSTSAGEKDETIKDPEYNKKVALLIKNYVSINAMPLVTLDTKQMHLIPQKGNTFTLNIEPDLTLKNKKGEVLSIKTEFTVQEDMKKWNKVEFTFINKWDKEFTTAEEMVYDINIPTGKQKGIDIRSDFNREKTVENLKKKMAYKLDKKELETLLKSKEYKDLSFLNNSEISDEIRIDTSKNVIDKEDLSSVDKFKDKVYYKTISIKDKWEYREMGKVFFDAKWDFTTLEIPPKEKDTATTFYNINLAPTFTPSTEKKQISITIDANKLDELQKKISEQKKAILNSTGLAEGASITLFPNLGRKDLENINNITLYPLRNLYAFDLAKTEKEWVNRINKTSNSQLWFWFDKENKIGLRDGFGEVTNSYMIEAADTKNRIILSDKAIMRYFEFSLAENALKSKAKKEKNIVSEKNPITEWINLSKYNTLYDNGQLSYFDDKGNLITKISCTKPTKEFKEWKLNDNRTQINPLDFYNKWNFEKFDALWKTPMETIYKELFTQKMNNMLDKNNTIAVSDTKWKANYYTLEQNNSGNFEFKLDKKLKETAKEVEDKMLSDIKIINTLNNLQMKNYDTDVKTEKDMTITSWLGWVSLGKTEGVDAFLRSNDPNRNLTLKILKDKTDKKDEKINFVTWDDSLTFTINKNNIELKKSASTTINQTTYLLKYDESKLIFVTPKATKE